MLTKFDGLALRYECQEARLDEGLCDVSIDDAINIPTSPFDSVRALTATIAAELGETANGSEHYEALFTLGILLFAVTFVINLTADIVVRGRKRKK